LQYTRDGGFRLGDVNANDFRDRWGLIHARSMHKDFYDPQLMRPSQVGVDYLVPIFTGAVGADDVEEQRASLFDPSHLRMPYHSVNADVGKRIRYLE
jgi:6-phosphofructokinase 1